MPYVLAALGVGNLAALAAVCYYVLKARALRAERDEALSQAAGADLVTRAVQNILDAAGARGAADLAASQKAISDAKTPAAVAALFGPGHFGLRPEDHPFAPTPGVPADPGPGAAPGVRP